MAFPPSDAAPAWETTRLRPADHTRCIESDLTTEIATLVIEDDFGRIKDADHRLIIGIIARETWSIHPDDPLGSSLGQCHWISKSGRDDLTLRTETFCETWSNTRLFFPKAWLEACENDVLIYVLHVHHEVQKAQPTANHSKSVLLRERNRFVCVCPIRD
ncbi:MAG: hypothetical protein GDA36_01955 [Rhodobacteraceae bacterium]|nr:hypothetical protein [Paracoccaceae bacterium]